jgi:adenylyltransferase/sulfurtransferase
MTLVPHTDDALARARVLIVGVGGLGAPAALALAEAGVGTLGLVDPDVVEVSNLHRQPLYDDSMLGEAKVRAAAVRLRALRPDLELAVARARFEEGLLDPAEFDVVIDGTDSIPAKFAVNDRAVASGRPLVHAGVVGFRAQVLTVLPRQSACYRCVFEAPPPADESVSCIEAGVLGPLPALVGALQAAEAVRLVTGLAPSFADRLLTIDVAAGTWRSVPLARRLACATCGPGPDAPAATRSDVP